MAWVVDQQDISLLSRARREAAFPLRIWRSISGFGIPVVFLMVAFLGVILPIIQIVRAWLANGTISLRPFVDDLAIFFHGYMLPLAIVTIVAVYRMSKGGRFAWLIPLGAYGFILGQMVYYLIDDLRFGFDPQDFRKLAASIGKSDDYSDFLFDIRMLPVRLYLMLLFTTLVWLVWRVGRIHVLPKFKPIRPFRQIAIESTGEFRLLFSLVRRFSRTPRFLARPLLALILYFLYTVLLVASVMNPFSLATSRSEMNLLRWVSELGDDTTAIVFAQIFMIVFLLVLSRIGLWISKLLLRAARRTATTSVRRLRAADKRPPVLYLRSFRNDMIVATEPRGFNLLNMIFDPYREKTRLEELIVTRCFEHGPVIAIADPKTRLQPAGAARQHFDDAEWQGAVARFMQEAALIVVLMDSTENLQWEIHTLGRLGTLHRTLFVLPPPVGHEGVAHAKAAFEMLRGALAASAGETLTLDCDPAKARLIAVDHKKLWILTSQTATYSDYDAALRLVLTRRPARSATGAKSRP